MRVLQACGPGASSSWPWCVCQSRLVLSGLVCSGTLKGADVVPTPHLLLCKDENKAATRSVILRTRYRGSCVSVEAPATLKDCLAAGFQHFDIDPACTDTRVFWRSPNDGLVEVTDDSFFARMGHLWTLQFDVRDRLCDRGKIADEVWLTERSSPSVLVRHTCRGANIVLRPSCRQFQHRLHRGHRIPSGRRGQQLAPLRL